MVKILKVVGYVILAGAVVFLSFIVRNQSKRIKFQEQTITSLQKSLDKAIAKTAISFSISPEIHNKVTSAFGNTKNVTMQYYFNLDGKAIIAQPDSVYHIVKEYNE